MKMYKSCKKCLKLTDHNRSVNKVNGKAIATCKVCGSESSGLTYKKRAEIEERNKEIYKEKTFDELRNSIRKEMNKDD